MLHDDAPKQRSRRKRALPRPGTTGPLNKGADGAFFKFAGRRFRVSMDWVDPLGCREIRGWGKKEALWSIPGDVEVQWE